MNVLRPSGADSVMAEITVIRVIIVNGRHATNWGRPEILVDNETNLEERRDASVFCACLRADEYPGLTLSVSGLLSFAFG
jgi:hypothetical protein